MPAGGGEWTAQEVGGGGVVVGLRFFFLWVGRVKKVISRGSRIAILEPLNGF